MDLRDQSAILVTVVFGFLLFSGILVFIPGFCIGSLRCLEPNTFVTYLSFVASVILTGGILLVYLYQTKILENQQKISEMQKEIMETKHVPILGMSESQYQLQSTKPQSTTDGNSTDPSEEEDESGDWFAVTVSNVGKEVAGNFRLALLVDIEDQPFELEDSATKEQKKVEYRPWVGNITATGPVTRSSESHAEVIPPDSNEILLRTVALINKNIYQDVEGKNIDKVPSPLCDSIKRILFEAEKTVTIGFLILFSNPRGKEFHLRLEPAYQLVPSAFDDLDENELKIEHIRDFGEPYYIDDLYDSVIGENNPESIEKLLEKEI